MKGLKIFIVDDEPLMRLSMQDALEGVGCEVMAAATGTEGVAVLGTRQFDIVITDLRLPGADGLTILKTCKERSPTTEVILITAHGSVDTAVGAIKLGAYDYITKPFQMDELLLIVERVGKIIGLRRENLELKEVLEDRFSFGGIHGRNHQMRALLDKIKLIAAADSPVSLVGERGTGKELVAHTIHLNSPRRDQPLIKMCCADLPDHLLEAELFGHEKGAVPGASRQDLKEAVAQGRFRQDLCDHLAAVQVVVPPLRERREDVLVIAEHVLELRSKSLNKSPKGFSQPSCDLLLHYSFPGNVGELEQMVERAVTLGRNGEPLQPWDLCGFQSCPYLGGAPQATCGFCAEGLSAKADEPAAQAATTLATAREAFEKDYIETVLKQVDGSRTSAAAVLGLSRKALWDKCKRYGISSAKGEAEERDE